MLCYGTSTVKEFHAYMCTCVRMKVIRGGFGRLFRTGRPEKFRHRKGFNTTFEGELLDEFTKQCQTERKDRNEIMSYLMEWYLNKKVEAREQKLSIYSQTKLAIIPDVQASNEEWSSYWNKVEDIKEAARLEGLFHIRHNEAKQRYYQLKVKSKGNKTVGVEAKVYK